MNKPVSKLGVGPMSPEIVEAVFKFSQSSKTPLMLISSLNQVNYKSGYVNGWTTKKYANFVKKTAKKYPRAKVYLCRDHCGPGFSSIGFKDIYKSIDDDIENDFDLIHIDFCHLPGGHKTILNESKKAILYILNKRPNMLIEVGTDENSGDFLSDLSRVKNEIEFFTKEFEIHFFVCQTGSLIKEISQEGSFNASFLRKIKGAASYSEIFLKEHNADYLSRDQIGERGGIIDAMNVAPQYGVIQTNLTIQMCLKYGIDFSDFLEVSYKSKKWKKWMSKNKSTNKHLCSLIAGHYNFTSDEFRRIVERINKYENYTDSVSKEISANIKLYTDNLQ